MAEAGSDLSDDAPGTAELDDVESSGDAATNDGATGGDDARDPEQLRAELAVLRERNERLREAYAAAERAHHRRTALGFAALGVLALAASAVLPGARDVLLALGGTGLFAAVLVVYLSPGRFVAASVGRDVYRTMADNDASLVGELGLTEDRVYVPVGEGDRVRLFVPQHPEYELPASEELTDLLVVPAAESARGIALRPTGDPLVDEFERSTPGDLDERPGALAEGLAEALVEQFELLDGTTVEAEPGRVTVAVTGSAFGPVTGFDHPVSSVLAVGIARGLSVPVECSVRASADDRTDWQVTCRWDADGHEQGR